ncbi:hypothetical protein [uncultured Cedecea sp.]|uniref:hypothetical protein n=1 Tax=uncultured Cedecea sp. TaxID=988762 RepID=UPI0026204BC4|nr:hypothetical protein [uncultured Cedecea sp.]
MENFSVTFYDDETAQLSFFYHMDEFMPPPTYSVLITREMKKYSVKNDVSNISRRDLKTAILFWYKENIIELVSKNISQDNN